MLNPPPLPAAQGTQRGLRCGERPCGAGTANSPAGTTSRPGPSAPLFSPGFREGGGQDPVGGGQAPRSVQVPEGPCPPPAAAGSGGGRAVPIPGQTSPPSARAGPRYRQRERRAGCLSNPSTFLHRARYVTDRGAAITQGPGEAGRSSGGEDAGLTRLLGCPWARPAQPNPERREGLGVTFRRAAGS